MSAKHGLAIVLALPLLLGMRDPFQPPDDPCRIAQLPLWRYYGVIASQTRQIGLLRDATGNWRRVQPESQLPAGWQIRQFTEREMLITTGAGCEPARWRWQRESQKNEVRDSDVADSAAAVARYGDTEPASVDDGR
ncbi:MULTISPECIES: HofP DNA utilization family protein [unclassified Enterobacter]|uniref:HofP DNA utilization family protein n=1 Tax=unclassified Enterobacter TaxID=2608935 RepID=UPI000F492F58|nr:MULTISPECIES: HofP DNA utilization family protein [unclassified Enterobacter]